MAKKRKIIGNVTKSKDGKSYYIKINDDVVLKKGEYVNLENEASQLEQVNFALEKGWINEGEAEKRRAQVVAYWNDPIKTKDGGSFKRKDINRFQVVISENE